ncbi:immunoglobulin-like domain-containing protein [Ammoniphilus sp. CFH 90114]|uniref:immunoglobulin-like domain-containing protein n=1 Tax=Ammoniphilus sp. CFH 90114 TaxID=2493665 RepID=UPI00100F6C6F|nr:immunoglobulin-like domain-containing protein [Ammoniphilus sp. CFH 90114]RXT04581.1 hypothetical protein EIZ39_20420 [Ammoniphilus sp. CFH 90114]
MLRRTSLWTAILMVGVMMLTTFATPSHAEPEQWQRIYSVQSIRSLVWDGTQYVGVGGEGTIFTSVDGQSWEQSSAGTPNYLTKIIKHADQWIAVGGDTIVTSSNGQDWEKVSGLPSNLELQDVTWGNGLYVAVGLGNYSDNVILTSPDGINWTPSSFTSSLATVTWGNQGFIAVGWDGTILTSSNGLSWKKQEAPSTIQESTIFLSRYVNGRYFIGTHNKLFSSTDGKNWTETNVTTRFNTIIETSNGYMALASNNTQPIFTSLDGLNWTQSTSFTFPSSYFTSLTEGNGKYIITADKGRVWYSSNGTDWDLAPGSEIPPTELKSIAWGNGMYVLTAYGRILTSPNGVNWTLKTSGVPQAYSSAVSWNGDQFIIAWNDGTIMTSPNGTDWTTHTNTGISGWISGFIKGDGTYIITTNNATIYTSMDGIHWTPQTLPKSVKGVTWGNGMYVLVGYGVIYTSPDGTAWTEQNSGVESNQDLTSVTYGKEGFVAGGRSSVLTSADGIHWTKHNVNSSLPYSSGTVVWGFNEYQALFSDSMMGGTVICSSPDGTNWSCTPNLGGMASGITVTDKGFAVIGYNTTIWVKNVDPLAPFNQSTNVSEMMLAIEAKPDDAFAETSIQDSYLGSLLTDQQAIAQYAFDHKPYASAANLQQAIIDGMLMRQPIMALNASSSMDEVDSVILSWKQNNPGFDFSAYDLLNEEEHTLVKQILLDSKPTDGYINIEAIQHVMDDKVKDIFTQSVAADQRLVTIGYSAGDQEDRIINDLVLPTSGENGSVITWTANKNYIQSDGTVTRPPHEAGDQSVTLTATIQRGSVSVQRTYMVTVMALNEAPVAGNDYYNTYFNQPIQVASPGLLQNDRDADQDQLTAELVTPTVSGTVYVEPNGSFAYYPGEGFSGADSFSYRVKDGFGAYDEATVSLFVYDTLSADKQVAGKPTEIVTVPIRLTSQGNVAGLQFDLTFNTAYGSLEGITAGRLLTDNNVTQEVYGYGHFDYYTLSSGKTRVIVTNLSNTPIGGEVGVLLNVDFQLKGHAVYSQLSDGYEIPIKLENIVLTDRAGVELTGNFQTLNGSIQLVLDKEEPILHYSLIPDPTARVVRVDVNADGTGSDITSLKVAKDWVSDVHSFPVTTATDILANASFDIIENTTYTVFAEDEAGNKAIQRIHVMGDADFSKVVDVTDWLAAINYVLERVTPSKAQRMVVDMNRDQELNVIDPVIMANVITADGYENYYVRNR